MKAKLMGSMTTGADWIYEIKFDGYRAFALRGGIETRILSRNQFAGRVGNKIRVDNGARIEATGHRTKAPMTGVQCNF